MQRTRSLLYGKPVNRSELRLWCHVPGHVGRPVEPLSGCLGLVEVRIMPGHPWHPGIRRGPDRVIGLGVLGAADAANEMVGHLRHWHALWNVESAGVDIEMPRRST